MMYSWSQKSVYIDELPVFMEEQDFKHFIVKVIYIIYYS